MKDYRIPKILLLRSRLIKLLSYKVPSSRKRKEDKGVATSLKRAKRRVQRVEP